MRAMLSYLDQHYRDAVLAQVSPHPYDFPDLEQQDLLQVLHLVSRLYRDLAQLVCEGVFGQKAVRLRLMNWVLYPVRMPIPEL